MSENQIHQDHSEDKMYEQFSHNPDTVKADLAYRRSQYAHKRTPHVSRRAHRTSRES